MDQFSSYMPRMRRVAATGALLVGAAPLLLGAASTPVGAAASPSSTPTTSTTSTTVPAVAPSGLDALQAELLALPDSASLDAPILWSGRVVAPDGTVPTGWVSATARPSALAGPEATAAGMLPVARSQIAPDGSFQLRVPMTSALAALAEDGGWTTFQVFVNSSLGVTMSTDSYRFIKGQWSTAPEAMGDATAAATSLSASRPMTQPTDEVDHPSSLTVQPLPAGLRARVVGEARVSPAGAPPPGLCTYYGSAANLGGYYTGVAEINLADNWSGRVVYRNTASTSISVGYSGNATAFSASGSLTRSKYNSAQQSLPISASGRTEIRAQMSWYRFQWECYVGGGISTPQYSLEYQDWLGGVQTSPSGSPPACEDRYRSNVNRGATYTRSSGSSESFTVTAGVAANFHPEIKTSFSVSAGSQSSSDVEVSYTNNGTGNRDICGVSDFPNHNTRIVAVK